MFELDEVLRHDSVWLRDLDLCQLRLINNANFPWVILVPRLNQVVEITDLSSSEYLQLNQEILIVAKLMQAVFIPDKLNIATLGNQVRQLHYHIIARYKADSCYPNPVWGADSVSYTLDDIDKFRDKINSYMDAL